MTISGQRFLATFAANLKDRDWCVAVGTHGLAGADADALRAICREEGESFEPAETEVSEVARLKAGLPTR